MNKTISHPIAQVTGHTRANSLSALTAEDQTAWSRVRLLVLESVRSRPSLLCWFVFGVVMVLFLVRNPFPSLYGDEYGSLQEAENWSLNPHAIGYFVQLHFWKKLGESDLFLRSLSIIWFVLGLYWLNRWLIQEHLSARARGLILVMAAANPYLWKYGTQVRFYAVFFAAAVLTMWRFRVWQQQQTRRNSLWLTFSALLLCLTHLFGLLVVLALLSAALWVRCRNRRWIFLAGGALMCLVLFVPPVTRACTVLVYVLTNRYARAPGAGMRGLSPAMVAKIPFTFFSFVLGERVYPLWWWISVPALALSGLAFLNGLRRSRSHDGMRTLAAFTLISVVCVFLVLDPLAPPALQGASPRYVIYALPIMLVLIGLGAERRRWLMLGTLGAELAGLGCLFWPAWSLDNSDLMNWAEHLKPAASTPGQTCILTDGRALAPVERYAFPGAHIITRDAQQRLFSCPTVVLASGDYRLEMTRWLDDVSGSLQSQYGLVSNTTLFPAQISVYERSAKGLTAFTPSRPGLIEQDLRTPLEISQEHWNIRGFVRLDDVRPSANVSPPPDSTPFWIATNFRSTGPLAPGKPVMALRFHGPGRETTEMILRAGFETAAWDGSCAPCKPLGQWTKRMHPLGAKSYPGAYRQYQAAIWGAPLAPLAGPITSVEVSTLLTGGTVYFFGFYGSSGGAQ